MVYIINTTTHSHTDEPEVDLAAAKYDDTTFQTLSCYELRVEQAGYGKQLLLCEQL